MWKQEATARPFKWKRTLAPPKEWRERLIRNCMDRMKMSRSEEVDRRRKNRLKVIREEAALLIPEETTICDEDLESLIADLEEAIDAERREAEVKFLQEEEKLVYDFEQLGQEMNELDSELFVFQNNRKTDNENETLCPVCERGVLHVREGVVFCGCGLRINGGTYDNINSEMVKERLEQVFARHSTCPSSPKFEVRHSFGTFLWATCRCGEEEIVI